jgi:hypothetical protein
MPKKNQPLASEEVRPPCDGDKFAERASEPAWLRAIRAAQAEEQSRQQ